jgi:hypothetical protein
VLKTLADVLYPASNATVQGVDGNVHEMTDDKWISRLCQFATDQGSSSSATTLLATQVQSLAERLKALNSLSSKGVHDNVSTAEVDQCMIQTYLVVGDLLRIAEPNQPVDAALQPLSA